MGSLTIDGLDVQFPYPHIYPEQYALMVKLKQSFDGCTHAMLELPSCVGRTAAILSLATSYQQSHPQRIGKLFYATRTSGEMVTALKELHVLERYRDSVTASAASGIAPTRRLVATGLPSRRMVESMFKERTEAGGADADPCCEELLSPGVNSLERVAACAVQWGWGGSMLAAQLARQADVVVCDYRHMLDPKLSQLLFAPWSGTGAQDLIIFSEAHNAMRRRPNRRPCHTLSCLPLMVSVLLSCGADGQPLHRSDVGAPAAPDDQQQRFRARAARRADRTRRAQQAAGRV